MWYSGMAPARPRLSSELERGALEMSSCVTTLRTFMPALPTIFMTMLPQSMSPAWFRTSSSTPWPLSAILTASNTSCGFGAAKMSPTTWMSTMPSPTKPHCAGSWPEPPKVTMVTRSAFSSARLMTRWPRTSTVSAWARARPSSSSSVRLLGSLINFFICIVFSSLYAVSLTFHFSARPAKKRLMDTAPASGVPIVASP